MKNFVLSALVVCFSLLFSFAVLEGILFIMEGGKDRTAAQSNVYYRPSENLDREYEFLPYGTGRTSGVDVTINGNGHRGIAGVKEKFDGLRILVVGDSISFGLGVSSAEAFPSLLHEELNKGDKNYQVLNLGVPGYDTIQAIAYLEEVVTDYQPDFVVLGFCLNDMGVVTLNFRDMLISAELRKKSRAVAFLAKKIGRIRQAYFTKKINDTAAFRAKYSEKIEVIGEDETELRELMNAAPAIHLSEWFKDEDRVGRLQYAFNRLAMLATQYEFEPVVVIFPVFATDEGDYPHAIAHQIVAITAEKSGLAVIDLVGAYMEQGLDDFRLQESDRIHPSVAGHEVASRVLSQYYKNGREDGRAIENGRQ